jgi:hypothetical protein
MTDFSLNSLPEELWVNITQYLTANEVFSLKLLRQSMANLVSSSDYSALILQPYLNRLYQLDTHIKTSPAQGRVVHQRFIEGFNGIKIRQQLEIAYLMAKHSNGRHQNLVARLPLAVPKTLEALEAADKVINDLNLAIIKSKININHRVLDLNNAGITRLPKELFDQQDYKAFWTNLTNFSCPNNFLSLLPKAMFNLPSMRVFHCHHNQLLTIPKEIGNCVALTDFDCSYNQLKTLPIELRKCKLLMTLKYRGNTEGNLPLIISKKIGLSQEKQKDKQINQNLNSFLLLWITAGYYYFGLFATYAGAILAAICSDAIRFRHQVKRQQYFNYDAKTTPEINNLTDIQQTSFKIGLEASKSYQKQFLGLFQWQAYRSPKAYYAGLQAGLEQDDELINKIGRRDLPH